MNEGHQIKYITHQNIDKQKWDACIDNAPNGLIYGYSYYLDAMAKHWDALVLNDYEAVMPLTWNKKYSFNYLYQPAFTASLGVFGKNLTEELVGNFIVMARKHFRFIEISLNTGNILAAPHGFSALRCNYVLNLNKNYTELFNGYRDNHKRNINKARQAGCTIKKSIDVDEIINLHKQYLKGASNEKEEDYINFKKLYNYLKTNNKAETYGVINKNNQMLASCVFFYSHNRAYYILVGNHPDGKIIGASHTLIDAFIKDHAGTELTLDFEGSDISNLAFFYSGFGATEELYPALRINRLPFYLRWMKG
jgi:hypothetical protein